MLSSNSSHEHAGSSRNSQEHRWEADSAGDDAEIPKSAILHTLAPLPELEMALTCLME